MVSTMAKDTNPLGNYNDDGPSLTISYLGSFKQLLLPGAGYFVQNTGTGTAENVIGTITIESGLDKSIYFTRTTELKDIEPGYSVGTGWLRVVKGFGPLTLTVNVEVENTVDISSSAKGFQIGMRTIIFE